MTVGLLLVAIEAQPEQRTPRGRLISPATPASVKCLTTPATAWHVTDPEARP